ncbi:hypothetical protein V6N13_040252 [Hibiscus sabdariffa]|uniref:Uncharacterized protein n=1 Tax=Hibiscus sabdariffa TaxID=183260 RepID=A0ABR2STX6_9ROSI
MRITKLTRWSWLLAQQGGALPHRRRTRGSVLGGASGFQCTASKIRTSLPVDQCRPILEVVPYRTAGERAVAFLVVLQDSNVLRPRSERACRWTTAVPFLIKIPTFIDLGEKEPSTSWEASHQVSGLMRITKLTRWSWLLAQQGGALPHRRRTRGSVLGGASGFQFKIPTFIDLGEKEPSTSWEASHQVSGLMRITKLTRWSWLLAQQGGALPHRRRTRGSVLGGASGFQCTASKIRTSLPVDHCRPILE